MISWTTRTLPATACDRRDCKHCKHLDGKEINVYYVSIPLEGKISRFFNLEAASHFRPLGVGASANATTSLEMNIEELDQVQEGESMPSFTTCINELEAGLDVSFWRARLGLALSRLKCHHDGPHQVNKLLVRIGSPSTFEIFTDGKDSFKINHPGASHATLIFMDNWHQLPHGYPQSPSVDPNFAFMSIMFKLRARTFSAWSELLTEAAVKDALSAMMDEPQDEAFVSNLPMGTAAYTQLQSDYSASASRTEADANIQEKRKKKRAQMMASKRAQIPCQHCELKCMSQATLDRHVFSKHMSTEEKRQHPDQYQHICDHADCLRTFDRKSDLNRHKATHEADREVYCPDCMGGPFVDLRNHKCAGTRAKNLKADCPWCGKAITKTQLKRHQFGNRESGGKNNPCRPKKPKLADQ